MINQFILYSGISVIAWLVTPLIQRISIYLPRQLTKTISPPTQHIVQKGRWLFFLIIWLISLLVTHKFTSQWAVLASLLLLSYTLICLAIIDKCYLLLPDAITLPMLWLGLLINSTHLITPLNQAVWGAALGYLFPWGMNRLFILIYRKTGMGHGDFKMMAMLGAWLGYQALPLIIFNASVLGILMYLLQYVKRKKQTCANNQPIYLPFGFLLTVSSIVMLVV